MRAAQRGFCCLRFEVLGDMANKVLADYVKKPSELKLDGAVPKGSAPPKKSSQRLPHVGSEERRGVEWGGVDSDSLMSTLPWNLTFRGPSG